MPSTGLLVTGATVDGSNVFASVGMMQPLILEGLMHEGYLARKLGLGVANPRDIDISPEDYVDEQLAMPIEDLALRDSISLIKVVEPWPEKFERPLKQQWRDEDQFHSKRRRLENKKNASEDEIEALNQLNDSLSWYHKEADAYQLIVTNIYSDNHVINRLNIFWSNHFTVGSENFGGDLIFSSKRLLNSKFKDLLYHSIKHPAMTTYLDNFTNLGENSEVVKSCKREGCDDWMPGMNDNLARELLELHTVSPARGYTEKDIHEVAKVLAGWGMYLPGDDSDWRAPIEENWVRKAAEPGNKVVLGKRISSGKKGLRELTDFLAEDPMTIEHLSRKLLRHFCGDPVDDRDVAAVAKVWTDTDGHLPAVHREVLIRAAYKPDQKFLWPLVWAWQVMRVTGGHPFMGVEQALKDIDERLTRRFPTGNHGPVQFLSELGMNFLGKCTPDGFPEDKADWVSNEHMDRRLRFSEWVYKRAANDAEGSRLTPAEIAERQRFSAKTLQIASSFGDDLKFYQLLMCSPEMMEV